jgi:hypothetical protein
LEGLKQSGLLCFDDLGDIENLSTVTETIASELSKKPEVRNKKVRDAFVEGRVEFFLKPAQDLVLAHAQDVFKTSKSAAVERETLFEIAVNEAKAVLKEKERMLARLAEFERVTVAAAYAKLQTLQSGLKEGREKVDSSAKTINNFRKEKMHAVGDIVTPMQPHKCAFVN